MNISAAQLSGFARERKKYDRNHMLVQLGIGALLFLSGAVSVVFSMLLTQEIAAGADEMTKELIGTGVGISIGIFAFRIMLAMWKKDRARMQKLEDDRYIEAVEEKNRAIKEKEMWRDRAMNNGNGRN